MCATYKEREIAIYQLEVMTPYICLRFKGFNSKTKGSLLLTSENGYFRVLLSAFIRHLHYFLKFRMGLILSHELRMTKEDGLLIANVRTLSLALDEDGGIAAPKKYCPMILQF